MTNIRSQKTDFGFTMVELLVVILLLAILAGFLVPNLTGTILPKYRLREAARTIATDMRLARMNAASINKQYRLVFTPSTDSYIVQKGNESSGSTSWTTDGPVRNFSDPNNAYYHKNIDIYSASVATVVCAPTGSMSMTTLILKNENSEQKQITSSISGRVKTE